MKAWTVLAAPAFLLGTLVAQAPDPSISVHAAGPPAIATSPTDPPVVKNAPYSAEMITTYDRVLPSGKYIHGETHGKAFRDSQGRTRKDADAVGSSGMDPKAVFVLIVDPVERRNITWDSRTRTAELYPWHPGVTRSAAPGPSRPDAAAVPGGSAAASPTANGTVSNDSLSSVGAAAKTLNTEDLGTREMEGLTVTGTKWSVVTDAPPAEGGQSETNVTTKWESKDLQILVVKETDDPQRGHTATRLVHILRTEPDAALFQIPAGYTVTDHKQQK